MIFVFPVSCGTVPGIWHSNSVPNPCPSAIYKTQSLKLRVYSTECTGSSTRRQQLIYSESSFQGLTGWLRGNGTIVVQLLLRVKFTDTFFHEALQADSEFACQCTSENRNGQFLETWTDEFRHPYFRGKTRQTDLQELFLRHNYSKCEEYIGSSINTCCDNIIRRISSIPD